MEESKVRKEKVKKGNWLIWSSLPMLLKKLVVAIKNELCKISNLERKPKLVLCVRTMSLKSEVIVFENN